ncbi:DUF2188 domain-containing protein [Mycobacterium avium]|uniref:DUF2188 domain-containing protein n=1 Tax=Mycobacterium avium TaxID=1764 RepID=UPI0009C0DFB5|nr:DUF2188 domain-containing protein [Mycobacterium avium]
MDWVITFTFDDEPSMETMDAWEAELEPFDASVSRVPGRGVDITMYAPEGLDLFEALYKLQAEVSAVVHAPLIGLQVATEADHRRVAEAPTMPELMSAAEIADALDVSRQRVHQLRAVIGFPAPLADLRGGAVWDAAAVRQFRDSWERRPGRPRSAGINPRSAAAAVRRVDLPTSIKEVTKMAERNSREVVPNAGGGWDVKKPGADRASAHYDRQSDAVDRARQILKNDGGGELRIHGRDGKIRDSDTIGRKDPYPPAG